MNYYSILGIAYNATSEEVKLAFRKLAKIHHPDKGGDEELFKEIRAAYEYIIEHPYEPPVRSSLRDGYVTPKVNPDAPKTPFRSAFDDNYGIWDKDEVEINSPHSEFNNELGFAGYLSSGEILYKIPLEVAYNGGKFWISIPNYEKTEIKLDVKTASGHKMIVNMKATAGWLGKRTDRIKLIIQIAQHEVYNIKDENLHCSFSISLLDILERVPLRLPHPNGKSLMPIQIPQNFELGQSIELQDLGLYGYRMGQSVLGSIIISISVELPELNYNQLHRIRGIIDE